MKKLLLLLMLLLVCPLVLKHYGCTMVHFQERLCPAPIGAYVAPADEPDKSWAREIKYCKLRFRQKCQIKYCSF